MGEYSERKTGGKRGMPAPAPGAKEREQSCQLGAKDAESAAEILAPRANYERKKGAHKVR